MLIEQARRDAGLLPYAVAIDNGFDTQAFQTYLPEHGVLRLVNVPRTPEHNTWIERGFRSVKDGVRDRLSKNELQGGEPLHLERLAQVLSASVRDMTARRRARRQAQRSRDSPFARDRPSRGRYDDRLRRGLANLYQLRCDRIRAENSSTRRIRQLERYALMETLQDAELVQLTRGGRPWEQAAWER